MTVQHVQSAALVPEVAEEYQPVTLDKHFTITPRGLDVHGEPPFEACEQLWNGLMTMERGIQFAIGDAMRYIKARWGEKASQIIHGSTGWSLSTQRVYEHVAEKVPAENRMLDRLEYSHHQAVAALPPREQKAWLKRASSDEAGRWSVARLKAEIRSGGDLIETGWFILITCDDAHKRDVLLKKLELDGLRCRAETRRAREKES